MPKIYRESAPVLLAQALAQTLEKYIKCGVMPDVGRDVLPDDLQGDRQVVGLSITSLDGSNTQVVQLEVSFPRVGISWEYKSSLCTGETEFYVNDRFISIKCTCSRIVTAILLRKTIQCPWCARVNNFTSLKNVQRDLLKAHEIIARYDPSWSGLEAKGRHEWLDGY